MTLTMNTTRVYKPHPLLLPMVKMVMVKEVLPWQGSGTKVYSYLPAPEHCIFFYPDNPIRAKKPGESVFKVQPSCVVVGPQVTRVDLELPNNHRAVMVAFQAGGLHRFLGIPMKEIFDGGYDGFDLLGPEVYALLDEVREMQLPDQINERVQSYLLARAKRVREMLPFDLAVRKFHDPIANPTVDDVAWESCLSVRQFQRKCHERLGMNPKLYARIARFSKAYRMFEGRRELTWSRIAHSCGYFDQMHFIRDFKQFAGLAPDDMRRKVNAHNFKFQSPMGI